MEQGGGGEHFKLAVVAGEDGGGELDFCRVVGEELDLWSGNWICAGVGNWIS